MQIYLRRFNLISSRISTLIRTCCDVISTTARVYADVFRYSLGKIKESLCLFLPSSVGLSIAASARALIFVSKSATRAVTWFKWSRRQPFGGLSTGSKPHFIFSMPTSTRLRHVSTTFRALSHRLIVRFSLTENTNFIFLPLNLN